MGTDSLKERKRGKGSRLIKLKNIITWRPRRQIDRKKEILGRER